MRDHVVRTCPQCGKRFGTREDITYCSRSCGAKARAARGEMPRRTAVPKADVDAFIAWAISKQENCNC